MQIDSTHLWGLFDMMEHFALKFCEAYTKLVRQIDAVFLRMQADRTKDSKEQQLSDGYKYAVAGEGLSALILEMDRLAFDTELRNKAKILQGRLMEPQGRNYTAEHLLDSLTELRKAICLELNKHKFAYLQSAHEQYFEQERLFGNEVYENFKSARQEIKDAGNCLATELWTASVFHLMRVAEYGLRALCYDRRVALAKSKPIDLATWEELLKELESAETKIQNYPKTLAREAQFDFYHGAMMELKRFKNLYRNKVSHFRGEYDEHEATGAFHHVKAFMEILAKRIGEGQRTPEIWKGAKWTKEI